MTVVNWCTVVNMAETRRNVVQIRLSDPGAQWLDEMSDTYGLPRSEVVRVALWHAAQDTLGKFTAAMQTRAEQA